MAHHRVYILLPKEMTICEHTPLFKRVMFSGISQIILDNENYCDMWQSEWTKVRKLTTKSSFC